MSRSPRPTRRTLLAAFGATLGATLLLGASAPTRAPTADTRARAPAHPADRRAAAELPFAVGERLDYDARVGPLKVGRGYMEVAGVEEVRGRDALHLVMRVSGGALGFRVREALDSWVDPRSFSSLRHAQDLREGRRARVRRYEIFPERAMYVELGTEEREEPSVRRPLDEASFLYFVRTVPLVVGEVYEFDRYFRPDRNPVRVRVARRERVTVPAGTFDALVIQPVIKTKGLLSESARTELWLSDDDRRILLKMVSQLPFGSLSLHLTGMRGTRAP